VANAEPFMSAIEPAVSSLLVSAAIGFAGRAFDPLEVGDGSNSAGEMQLRAES